VVTATTTLTEHDSREVPVLNVADRVRRNIN
jgi:hypothetical protein